MDRKFALHPGWIVSRSDGEYHYIGIGTLSRLYKLRPQEYIFWEDDRGYVWDDYIHLYPDYHGRYGRQ